MTEPAEQKPAPSSSRPWRQSMHLVSRLFAVCGLLLAAVVVVTALTPGASVSGAKSSEETYRQLTLFGDVFQRIREDYVDEVEDEELVRSAINGMLSALDPHSSFLSNDDFKDMQVKTRGEFGGLGIEVTMEDGVVKVVSPIDETPAARAGVKAGDLIIALDGESVLGFTLSDAVDRMRGPIGSDITITIRRLGTDPFDLTITRDAIKMRSTRYQRYGRIGYIRITTFSEQTTPGLEKAVEALRSDGKPLGGIVLDLRNNPGGLLNQAISVADAFLEQGEIVSTRGRTAEESTRRYARAGDITNGLPVVVLINSGSASASEIVAGALKDHGRALIMGTRSFGKGSVQSVIPMPGHGAIRLTTSRYYTPSGVSIQATGIEPDITVELAVVEKLDGGNLREEDLRGALDTNSSEEAADNSTTATGNAEPDEQADQPAIRDYQLARAIDLLEGLAVFSSLKGDR